MDVKTLNDCMFDILVGLTDKSVQGEALEEKIAMAGITKKIAQAVISNVKTSLGKL